MPPNNNTFYQYLGVHSLLIGIFPFYIPVYLWNQHFGLDDVSLFISLGGLGFCFGLWTWDRLRLKVSLSSIIAISLLLEIGLLFNVYILEMDRPTLVALGITYGIYNSFFWTTQRALFFDLIDVESSGRKYGNFQIFVGVLLQIGILIGGFLLDRTNFVYLLLVSSVIVVVGFFITTHKRPFYPPTLVKHKSLGFKDIVGFRDTDNSRLIFLVDGFFLFAESFFWVISLFLLAHQSFATLGVIVLFLAVMFGIVFYLLKNTIDRLGRNRVYRLAVGLYALSWALRAVTHDQMALEILYIFLIAITFCTSFFRLAMNKRFYDLAKLTISHDYLVLKSYYSQISIVVVFGVIAFVLAGVEVSETLLTPIYWASAVLALSYFGYGSRRYAS
jgi:MFS family permease